MINLLPLNEKIKVRSDYRLRLYTVIGLMLLILVISAMIPLVISYFAISYNVEFINDITEGMSQSEGFKKTDALAKIIKDTNRKSILLNDPLGVSARQNLTESFFSVFTIANELSNKKNSSIKITQITYEQATKRGVVPVSINTSTTTGTIKESGLHKITIRGFAFDRDIFLSFLKELETNQNFLNIDSPVSNLVNSVNIDFSIIITLKDKAM
ncbi:MAG: hypothetical protein UT05_C0003G0017 [Parcubacteria group bacterium GW2011_GWF2_38_76]|nr:MAG: hypothetical protein UT05_C0003G0017 [Parcubacteria group bacterium GW2011_GWF2_38_76]HBM46209.1 hypothetical protein [Patescibacteria group bacterium]